MAKSNEDNDLIQYYRDSKKNCGKYSNENCYSESTRKNIESIHKGIIIKDNIAKYISNININVNDDNFNDNNERLYSLMLKILEFRKKNEKNDYKLTIILNELINIIVKVIKTNYIEKIYKDRDNNSKLLELQNNILSYNQKIKDEFPFVNDTFTDILEFLSMLIIKLEKQKAEPTTTEEATKAEAPLDGGRKRKSIKREIKRRGRKSRKH